MSGAGEGFSPPLGSARHLISERRNTKAVQQLDIKGMEGRNVGHLTPISCMATKQCGETKVRATLAQSNSMCGSPRNKQQLPARRPGHQSPSSPAPGRMWSWWSTATSAALQLGAACTDKSPARRGGPHPRQPSKPEEQRDPNLGRHIHSYCLLSAPLS